jgi:methanogenic corrinoid protein MtbC1
MCSDAGVQEAILSGDANAVKQRTQQWLKSGHSVQEFRDTVLCPVVETIRQQFATREFFLPELLVSLRAAKAALGILDAAGRSNRPTCGKVVVGSLAWNGHGFCRDVIVNLLEVCGWDVVDLGQDVSPVRLADACAETRASVLVIAELSFAPGRLSARMPTEGVEALVKEMEARGIRQRTRILLVGLVSDGLSHGPHEVDAICDDLAEVPASVQGLAKHTCTESLSC